MYVESSQEKAALRHKLSVIGIVVRRASTSSKFGKMFNRESPPLQESLLKRLKLCTAAPAANAIRTISSSQRLKQPTCNLLCLKYTGKWANKISVTLDGSVGHDSDGR